MANATFAGFHPQTIQFLDQLAAHNHRDWFTKHKGRYESDVLEPALEFIAAMQKPLARISSHYEAVAKRTGGSLMRIYRDTRFSKDKTPYKTNIGIHFRHQQTPKDVHAPGFYVHIAPDESFLGCGLWRPDTTAATKIRKLIDKDPAGWKRATRGKALRRDFEFAGESLKRPPRGFSADHPWIEDLKRKDFIVISELSLDDLFDPAITKTVAARMRTAKPLMAFLCGAVGLKF